MTLASSVYQDILFMVGGVGMSGIEHDIWSSALGVVAFVGVDRNGLCKNS